MDWLSGLRETVGAVAPFLDSLPAIRVILAFILVFLLPGFAWTLVFFPGRQINMLERLALSIGLSIAVVVLTVLALHKLVGLSITGTNAILAIIVVTIVPVVIYYIKKLTTKQEDNTT